MDTLKDIIQRCHKRHAEKDKLRQRKTVLTPALYKRVPYHIKVHCARRTLVKLELLEQADISFMPMEHAPDNSASQDFGGDRFLKRQSAEDWRLKQWRASWGIQIYTGIPSERDSARWHDFEFTYQAICDAPETVSTCIEALLNTTATPLLTLTKSGGLRFSCRVQDYLHPDTDEARYFIYKRVPLAENPQHRDIYLEVHGDKGYSCWDTRYEILLGNLLEPPVIAPEVLFAPINKLRAVLHEPDSPQEKHLKDTSKTVPVVLHSLGSENLDLAKEAFLKRGFTYLHENNGFHYWISERKDGSRLELSLWEDQGIVWVRASTQDTEIPTRAMPITDVWNDTGISTPISDSGLPVSDKILAIREGELSPLAIKRPPSELHKQESGQKVYGTLEKRSAQLQRILKSDARILALTVSEADILIDTEAEAYILNSGPTCLNIPKRSLAEAAEERYRSRKLSSFARWRSRMYRWEQVKDIPIDARMANPFQAGNMCEDPERCDAVEEKGGNPLESICPQCPVYAECQERGYLSQPLTFQRVKAQITPINKLFLDPQQTQLVEQILGSENETARLCFIDQRKVKIKSLFLRCGFGKKVVEEWVVHWQGYALGNFAAALMNVLETQVEPYSNPIGQVRAVVEAFQQHKDEIIQQMCYINIRGRVVERRIVDTKTETELARYAIDFHGGATAYIPLDANAEERLKAMGQPYLPLDVVGGNSDARQQKDRYLEIARTEYIRIPMQMEEAVALGIYDVQTVEKIGFLPTVCRYPDWTYWHQLKRFFAHYPRDADASMNWSGEYLTFWVPPKLHPSVKRLLIISTSLSDQHFHRVFPDEEVEIIRIEPTAWVSGNQVLQLRTSPKSPLTLQNGDINRNGTELSKIGERYFFGIRAEINRERSVKHAVITNSQIVEKLSDLAEKENVSFVTDFRTLDEIDTDLKTVQVLWIVGMPSWSQRTIWREAQMLFGNDEKPLNYEGDKQVGYYEDERIQGVYNQKVAGLLTQLVGRVGLNRLSGKKVVLLTNFELSDITDRPETLLFDWEDFEIAGGLHKLEETVRTRERFEAERDKLTAESSREEVERVLGCSSRHANYILKKLRGGNIPRVSIREQILFLLSTGEKRTSVLVAAIDSSAQAIGNELKRLLDAGEIVRVQRGVYDLPD